MKKTLSRAERLAYLGVFTALALLLSYLEHLLPLPLPIPGFKLGLCHLVVLFAAYFLTLLDAALLSFVRVIVSALLFGNITSFLFSLTGTFLSFFAIVFAKKVLKGSVSFIGASALSAAAFNVGQILAAAFLYAGLSVFGYLPLLLIASALFGGVVGLLLNLVALRLRVSFDCRKESL